MNNSVIIPIYNVEDRLLLCMDSLVTAFRLVRQAHPEFLAEVICVDDGSTDESGEILDSFVRETNIEGLAFKAFHQNNAGPSVARNRGLEIASGDWVSFVDSDDEVMPEYFKAFYGWPHKADIVFFSMKWCYPTGEEEIATLRGFEFQQGRESVADVSLKLTGRQHQSRFVEGQSLSEDEAFIFEVCLREESLSVMPDALYNYKIVTTGLTNNPNRPVEWLSDIFYSLGKRAKERPLKKLAYGFSLAVLVEDVLQTVSLLKARKFVGRVHDVRACMPLSRDCPVVAVRIASMPHGKAILWMLLRQLPAKLSRRLKG